MFCAQLYPRAEMEHDAMRMQEMEISDYARQLFEAHGDKAIAEAARPHYGTEL